MREIAFACLLLLCTARPAVSDQREFLGPAPVRNFHPIQLIFLNLPFERPQTLGRGRVELHVQSAESNEAAIGVDPLLYNLKFETNRTVFGARYGLARGWEVGIDLPFITRYGGFLDPFINAVESAFDAKNAYRDIYPDDRFGAFAVARGDTVLFHGHEATFQPGDLWLSLKRQIPLREGLPSVALRAAIKAPTGDPDNVLGSGKPDFGLGLAAEQRLLNRLMVYLNLDFVYPVGPITPARLTLNPIFSQAFAAEFSLTRRWSAVLHEALYTSPMHGTGSRLLDDTLVEAGLGLNLSFSSHLGFQLMGINNVTPVETGADFSLILAVTVKP